jgi:hypothetical protein
MVESHNWARLCWKPTRGGAWQQATAFADVKVRIVDAFESFAIAYPSFPGIP